MKKYLVIGNPINHSLSPKLQNWWLKENNINATYDKIVDLIKGKVSKLRLLTYTKLLFAIKTLERAGDHIENIAEEIHFIVTGLHIDVKRDTTDNKLEDAIEESNK